MACRKAWHSTPSAEVCSHLRLCAEHWHLRRRQIGRQRQCIPRCLKSVALAGGLVAVDARLVIIVGLRRAGVWKPTVSLFTAPQQVEPASVGVNFGPNFAFAPPEFSSGMPQPKAACDLAPPPPPTAEVIEPAEQQQQEAACPAVEVEADAAKPLTLASIEETPA